MGCHFKTMKYKYIIGIDCGVETGLAVWVRGTRKLDAVESCNIIEAMNFVIGFTSNGKEDVLVRVEDARLRTWIPHGKNEKEERGRREGAGSVKRDAKIWEEFLTHHGIPFEMVAPKNNKTKTTADYFKKITGWKEQTNEHARDAAMLVFGF